MPRPAETDYAPFYHTYVSKVSGNNIKEVMALYSAPLLDFFLALPEEKADYRYADGKWTVKELLLHIIDAERIFAYRALRIARKDATPLAGFEEDDYATNSYAASRSLQSLKDELAAVRRSTDILLDTFNEEQLAQRGTASNQPVTANAIAFIVFGHILHHKKILEERYL